MTAVQIDNKIERFLSGPFLFTGIVFLIPGLLGIFLQHWILGGINLFISWFLFGTYSGVEIDTKKRIFKQYNCWFGLFKTGTWKMLDHYLGVTFITINKVYRIYSRSNRVNASNHKEFSVYLVNKNKRPALVLKKCKTRALAQRSVDEFSIWLKMPVFSIVE